MSISNTLVGSAIERVEDRRLLMGKGQYVADIKLPGMAYAVVLRSSVAHGRIVQIDVENARGMPGVFAVFTGHDLGSSVPKIPLRQQTFDEGIPYLQPVIATDRVRYVGEPLAIVVAASASLAEDALGEIQLSIDELPAVVVCQDSKGVTELFPGSGSNCPVVLTASKGEVDKIFPTADYVRKEKFSVQRHGAMPMETRGLLAEWRSSEKRLVVYGAAKVPFFNRNLLAKMLEMQTEDVDLIEVDVGGGFGARGEFYPEDFLVPYAAKALQRPVRWIEDRREHFTAMNHAREMAGEIEIACMKDGTVVGLRGRVNVDIGAYVRTNGFTAPRNVAQFLSGPYHVPNIRVEAAVYVTNKTPAGTYRGPGRFESSFFVERLFDMAARDLGIDAAQFRLKNLVTEQEMPFPLARMSHKDPSWDTELDGGAYHIVLQRCLDEFGWTTKNKDQGKIIEGRYHGFGLGFFVEGGAAGPHEGCRITMTEEGGVILAVGSSALGQGLATILSQIASDALDIPTADIQVEHGSTTLVKEGFGSFHSRSTVMGGNAVLEAAAAFKDEIRRVAAEKFDCEASDVTLGDRCARYSDKSLTYSELGKLGCSAERSFTNTKHTYSYGAHAVHVSVDPDLADVRIHDYLTVEDVGRIINPATLHGQVLGSVVQGLGSVFLEELHYDARGQILTGSFADYLLPTATDFPYIRSISLGLRPCPNNPLGAKGAGEGGLISVGGAVGNAIAGALSSFGVEPCHTPFTPARLWGLIQECRMSRGLSLGGKES
jgi:aerobic carbon-monoxide dehydrogenase large subunit